MEFPNKGRQIIAKIAMSAFVTATSALNLQAQEQRPLSLSEAIQLSIDNSKSLKIAKAKILQSSAEWSEAKTRRLPDLQVSGSYLRMNEPNVQLKVPLNNNTGNGQQSGNEGAGTSSIKVDQAMYGMVNASLPLFSGLRITHAIESSKYLLRAAELDAEHDKSSVIQNTISAYYNLYKAKATVALVQENKKTAAQRVLDFSNMEQNGLLARNDLLKAQLQEGNVELTLLDALNNEAIAMFNLNLMLGLPQNTELILTDQFPDLPNITTLEEWENMALQHRADLNALLQRTAAAEAGVKIAKGEFFPGVAITGGYIAADVPQLLTVTNAVNFGVGLSYNLASLYKTPAKVRAAKAKKEQLDWTGLKMSDEIRMQMHRDYRNYVESLKKIEVHKKAVEQANENYRITKNKYDNALATTTDLLDADVAKLQANINYEYAKADAVVAYNKLYETAGLIPMQ
jgi:outer membrane protein